jgi:hypothetical protein
MLARRPSEVLHNGSLADTRFADDQHKATATGSSHGKLRP